jgi:hypothetical protein
MLCGYGSRIALRVCGTTAVDWFANSHDNREPSVIASAAKQSLGHP